MLLYGITILQVEMSHAEENKVKIPVAYHKAHGSFFIRSFL